MLPSQSMEKNHTLKIIYSLCMTFLQDTTDACNTQLMIYFSSNEAINSRRHLTLLNPLSKNISKAETSIIFSVINA